MMAEYICKTEVLNLEARLTITSAIVYHAEQRTKLTVV